MGIGRLFIRTILWGETVIARVLHADAPVNLAIEAYGGYATPTHLIARGRVLAARKSEKTEAGASKLANARQMLRLFITREVANVTVSAGDVSAVTNEEGYFTLKLLRTDQHSGWVDVAIVANDASVICPVLVPAENAQFAVISDIDDTMMHTGAYSLWRNLWTSLTGNATTRQIFPDAKDLVQVLHLDGRNPVYFVSSSPWNFHSFLDEVFERAGLPQAPKFLRDYGFGENQFITGTHGDHKGDAIDQLMAANPDLPVVLLGDTGQHDAQIYAKAALRHPGRIAQVVLRAPGHGADAQDALEVERLRALAIPVLVAPNYREAISHLTVFVRNLGEADAA